MINTEDLTSYYSGYDEYCEPSEKLEDNSWDLVDIYHEEMMIRKEIEKMERKVIDLNNSNMTFEEVMNLKDYVWKNDKLIPIEMIGDE